MSEKIEYREFDEEESRVYQQAVDTIRGNVKNGITFDLACEFIDVKDEELKQVIIDDALKIEIAEMHYGKGMTLRDVSKALGVSIERLLKATHEMMEDVMNTAGEAGRTHPGPSSSATH